jgi:hypothetical protein
MITNDEIMVSITMIRILDGMMFRKSDIVILATPITTITDKVMTTEGSSFTVMANAEQIPSV